MSALCKKSRGDVVLYLVLAMALLVCVLGWMLVRDESKELQNLAARTNTAWLSVRTCLLQRNAVLRLAARMLSKEEGADTAMVKGMRRRLGEVENLLQEDFSSPSVVIAESAVEEDVTKLLRAISGLPAPRFEKLGDLLASSQNRLVLERIKYDRRARLQRRKMASLQGVLVSRMIKIKMPAVWGPAASQHG